MKRVIVIIGIFAILVGSGCISSEKVVIGNKNYSAKKINLPKTSY